MEGNHVSNTKQYHMDVRLCVPTVYTPVPVTRFNLHHSTPYRYNVHNTPATVPALLKQLCFMLICTNVAHRCVLMVRVCEYIGTFPYTQTMLTTKNGTKNNIRDAVLNSYTYNVYCIINIINELGTFFSEIR
jgi:hypothetical protein